MDTLTVVTDGGKLVPKRGVSAVAVMSSVAFNHSAQMLFGVGEWRSLEEACDLGEFVFIGDGRLKKVGEQCSRVGWIVLL